MRLSSISVRCLTLLGVVLLTPGLIEQSANAGDLFRKKGQLIAVPVAQPAASPSILYALPTQPAQVSVLHVPTQQALVAVPSYGSVAKSMVQVQQHAPPERGDSPSIQITVIEGDSSRSTPSPQASGQLQGKSQTQVQYFSVQPQSVTYVAPIVSQAVAVPQATPVQIYYVPPAPKRSWFKSH
ncbi:hypothetical protein [Tautonia marina]|uniref:hypothetical protein n=1 Tax=Tautonia marina TaxID=2653855 RepID=UPI001260DDED|nr:hypothetical protein [Tautonia marina]